MAVIVAYHIVNIDAPRCVLSCRDKQLICRSEESSRSVPLEDVGAVVVTSFSASIHSHLLIEAAKQGIGFILCENFKPAAILLPANRCSDTHLTRAQVSLKPSQRERLWQKTVDAKCRAQLSLAKHLAPGDPRLYRLEMVATGKHPTREAETARAYWPIFGDAVCGGDFTRNQTSFGANSLLNYGYAVLLAIVLRDLLAVGIDPTFGIFHATRERSTALAYDLMEPFRPWVDCRVARWLEDRRREEPGGASCEVNKEFRAWVTAFPSEETEYAGSKIEMRCCIEKVMRSFRKALIETSSTHYRPWTPSNSKWAG